MAELHTYHSEEERSQAGSLEQEEHRRLREEIQQQIEAERAASVGQEQQQQQQTRRKAATLTSERETARQRQTVKSPVRKRAYGMDALLLCALTMGVGMFLGPSLSGLSPHRIPYDSSMAGAIAPDLLKAPFDINGADEAGNVWDGSDMQFTSIQPMSDGTQQVTGHFDWQEGGNYAGREDFTGSYDPATHEIHLQGTHIEQANTVFGNRLVLGDYIGQTGLDGKTIADLHMEQIPGGARAIPGDLRGVQQP